MSQKKGSAGSGSSGRGLDKVRVKRKKGRKASSQRWLQRQLNDSYVFEAQKAGYRSRAAFKLIELNDKFDLFNPGMHVIDLGAAPGGWTQIALDKYKAANVVGVDLLEVEPVAGATLFVGDLYDDDMPEKLQTALGQKADVVLSDMAANTVGHPPTDHLRTIALAELAADLALTTLKKGGHFVCKVFQGGANKALLNLLKGQFEMVKHYKPPASRKGSPETYLVAKDFIGDVES